MDQFQQSSTPSDQGSLPTFQLSSTTPQKPLLSQPVAPVQPAPEQSQQQTSLKEEPPVQKSNLKLWIIVFTGIVVVSIAAVLILGKTRVYKGTGTAPEKMTSREEEQLPVKTTEPSISPTPQEASQARAQGDAEKKPAAEEVSPISTVDTKSAFEIGCENNAGSFDTLTQICSILTIGKFTSLEELTKSIDAHATCITEGKNLWNSINKECVAKHDTLKGSIQDLVSVQAPQKLSMQRESASEVEKVIALPDESETTPKPPDTAVKPVIPPSEVSAVPTEDAEDVAVAADSATPPSPPVSQQAHGAYIQGKTGPGLLAYPLALVVTQLVWLLRKKK